MLGRAPRQLKLYALLAAQSMRRKRLLNEALDFGTSVGVEFSS